MIQAVKGWVFVMVIQVIIGSHALAIVNGEDADPNDYPGYVQLMKYLDWEGDGVWIAFCGGAHIGEGYVVTAAHCIEEGLTPYDRILVAFQPADTDFEYLYSSTQFDATCYEPCLTSPYEEVDFGGHVMNGNIAYVGSSGYEVTSINIISHGEYFFGSGNHTNDIAVMHINEIESFQSLDLPGESDSSPGNPIDMIGRGSKLPYMSESWSPTTNSHNQFHRFSHSLQKISASIREDIFCEDNFNSGLQETYQEGMMICTGKSEVIDGDTIVSNVCSGDSGSPLVGAGNTILGIAAVAVDPCTDKDGPSIYMDLHYFMESGWIDYAKRMLSGNGFGFQKELIFNQLSSDEDSTLIRRWKFANNSSESVTLGQPELCETYTCSFSIEEDSCGGQTIPKGGSCEIVVKFSNGWAGEQETMKISLGSVNESISLKHPSFDINESSLAIDGNLDESGNLTAIVRFEHPPFGTLNEMRFGRIEVIRGDVTVSNGCEYQLLRYADSCEIEVQGSNFTEGVHQVDFRIVESGEWLYYRASINVQLGTEDDTSIDTGTDGSSEDGSGNVGGSRKGGSLGVGFLMLTLSLLLFGRLQVGLKAA